VAHEINNPLSFLLGNLELLNTSLQGDEAAEIVELLSDVLPDMVEGARRIATVMADLRALTIATNPSQRAVDVRRVLELTLRTMSHARATHLPVLLDLDDVPLLQADEGQLVQVFLHLLEHALGGGGAQSLSDLSMVTVRLRHAEPTRLLIEIEDRGPGLTPNELEQIRGSTYQHLPAHQLLGLTICRYALSQLNGTLEFESQVGAGTTARVWLPLRLSNPSWPDVSLSAASVATQLRRVIIIDDEAALGRMLPRLLQELWEVRWYRSAEEALVALESGEEPDVILCDLSLPGLNGMGFYHRLVQQHQGLAVCTGFLSGGPLNEETALFLDTVRDRSLLKPFGRAALLELLERLDGMRRAAQR
jgi:CheY-like chemotaxis protein